MTNKKILFTVGVSSLFYVSSVSAGTSFCKKKNPSAELITFQEQFCEGGSLNEEKIGSAYNLNEKQVDLFFKTPTFPWSQGSSQEEILENLKKYQTIAAKKSKFADKSAQDLRKEIQQTNGKIAETDTRLLEASKKIAEEVSYQDLYDQEHAKALKECRSSDTPKSECPEVATKTAMKKADAAHKEIEKQKRAEEEKVKKQEYELQALAESLLSSKEKFNKAYKDRFEKYAIEKLQKNGTSANSLSDVEKVCFGETITDKAKSSCDQILADRDKFISLNAQVDDQLKKIDKTKSAAELLGLKLNNDILSDKIARNEVLGKAQEALKGTVFGEMIEGMKQDMCQVVAAPDIMCPTTNLSIIRQTVVDRDRNFSSPFQQNLGVQQRTPTSSATGQ